jgi:hypothetical protein
VELCRACRLGEQKDASAMTPKALTAALIVQFASIPSLIFIPYGLMFSDANRFIQLDRDAVGRVVRQFAAVLIPVTSADCMTPTPWI